MPSTNWTEETFRALTDESADIISLLDGSGRLVFNSAAAQRTSGYSAAELEGVDTFDLIHPDDRAHVREKFVRLLATPGSKITVQYRYRHKSGGFTWMEAVATNLLDNSVVRGIVANSRDISVRVAFDEQKRLLAEREERERVTARLATLAGGVAHDFNNLLAIILGETELLREGALGARAKRGLDSIATAAKRAADLTSLLLTYAGRGRYHREPVDLAALLTQREFELRQLLGEKIHLTVSVDEPVGCVEANLDKVWQILQSLTVNAAEAFAGAPGEVRIEVGRSDLTEAHRLASIADGKFDAGPSVTLSVTDTACGMSEEVRSRVFEPFYSTKSTGRGLGLAAVAGIVRSFRGHVGVVSEPGRGSTFTIHFRPTEGTPAPLSEPLASFCGHGLALVVDDQAPIADITARYLASLGFSTEIATSGQEALDRCGGRLKDFRIVVLDRVMPAMDGAETFRRIRELRADMPVLFYSGYPGDVSMKELTAPGTQFLQKPFSRDDLGRALKRLLGDG